MLGDDIRAARVSADLTARELAAIAGISPEAVSAIERGRSYPNLQTLEAIAGPLHVRFVIGPDETIVERA
jgi:transcriptional regulator with XRE-family HTH domain